MQRNLNRAAFLLFSLLAFTTAHKVCLSAEKEGFSIPSGGSCVSGSCHVDMAKKKYVHGVAADGSMCTECHEMEREGMHSFKLKAWRGELCGACHEKKADKKYNHDPVVGGECTSCHDPHQSDHPKQLVMPPTSLLCFLCHDEGAFKGSTPHGPVTEGKCLECHHPHSSDHRALVQTPQPELCLGCHSNEVRDPKGIGLPSTKELLDDKGANLHLPFAEGMCTECHFPHPTDTYRLLKGNYPPQFYALYTDKTYESCLRCHEDFGKALSEPRTLTETAFRNGNLNLHHRHVSRAKGRTCRACHHHHGSKNPKLLREAFPFGKRRLTMEYEKTPTGGSCAPACHVRAQYDRYEPVQNMMKTTPKEGRDATPEELELSRQRDTEGIGGELPEKNEKAGKRR